jgi:hypothetical protein
MIGLAAAMLLAFATTTAHAQATVVCKTKLNTSVDNKGGDGSECFASSDGTSEKKAHSEATGNGSFADAEEQTGSHSRATATGGSFSEATSDTHAQSTSDASNGSSVTASSDHHGVAKATADGSSSEADASAFGRCEAKAKATGTGSLATAECGSRNKFAHATATNGGTAHAFDNASPTCDPGASGTAKVRSSGGNCG